MKKLLSVFLAFALLLSLTIPISAANSTSLYNKQ